MQLISAFLFLLSVVVLSFAVLFVRRWHKGCERASVVRLLREHIEHIGISAVVEYPNTPRPLLALLDEEYTRSEAIVVTDLQHYLSSFGELIRQYNLVRVNHTHLEGVRALYRSRHRAFRRVVLVDLPVEHRANVSAVVAEVASYDYILHLQGESIVEREAITYCANVVASHHNTEDVSMRTIVGAEARLVRNNLPRGKMGRELLADRALAWRKGGGAWSLVALFTPTIVALIAYLTGNVLMVAVMAVLMAELAVFMYVSCRVVTKKNLFVTLGTILSHFYRFIVERVKNNYYLYQRSSSAKKRSMQPLRASVRAKRNNLEQL